MDAAKTDRGSQQDVAVRRDLQPMRVRQPRPVVRATVARRAAEREAAMNALYDRRAYDDRVIDHVVDRILDELS